jgi:hypothetical protein
MPSTVKVPLVEILPAEVIVVPVEPYPPAISSEPVDDVRAVAPVEERVVKAPVEAVVAPIAVLLIPVAVVLKLLEVIVNAFDPVLIEDAPNPDRASAPEVLVIFTAPVVTVNPSEAVNSPAEVIAPEPVVETFPEVETVPSSVIVNFDTPPD